MNTETGRIYDLSELYPDEKTRAVRLAGDVEAASVKFNAEMLKLPTTEVQFSDPSIELSVREAREELAKALAMEKATLVSQKVAQTIKLGQREQQRRKKRRKAEQQARKRNR